MPCTVPRLIWRWMSLLACTGPKCLLIPISSIAKADAAASGGRCAGFVWFRLSIWGLNRVRGSDRAGLVLAEVVHLVRSRVDVGGGLVDGRLHFRGDQLGIVVVHSGAEAALGWTEVTRAGGDLAVLFIHEGVVGGEV